MKVSQKTNAPLYEAVKRASLTDARFCTPGHSGRGDDGLFASAPYDLTEVEGLDNLSCPSGAILEAEILAAKAQGCAHTLFATEGSTVCMHIALSIAKERGNVGFIGDMHTSFFGGCALLGIEPTGFESVEEFLSKPLKTRNVSSVFYTSPDYFGNVKEDDELIRECEKEGILTVVDAAHGAHFAYSPLLPEPSAGRADISFCSLHKTMNAFTGGALLNLKDGSLYDKAVYYRQLWHTTSPSYVIMASIDYARAKASESGEKIYERIAKERERFERSVRDCAFTVVKSDDISRLVLRFEGFDAGEANSYLVGKGIFAEAAIGDKLIFILTEGNVDRLSAVYEALKEYRPTKRLAPEPCVKRDKVKAIGAVTFLSPDEAEGRVCMNEIGFYPPGTPFIGRGEVFTAEDVGLIKKNAGNTFGLVNGKAVVLQ